ncbi:MAG: hypothetical protein ACW987_20165 [Candidatus Thorarchaeota archaeon]|jgi:hypothetical protein
MFGLEKKTKESVVTEPLPEPGLPTPAKVNLDNELSTLEMEEYAKVSKRIGYESASLFHIEFKSFLKEESIPIYNYNDVQDFLVGEVIKLRVETGSSHYSLSWVPMREQDRDLHDAYEPLPYTKTIPLFALLLVDKIHSRFGDKVKFQVSDYEAIKPDPFLRVNVGDSYYVIAHWDEPGFKGGTV